MIEIPCAGDARWGTDEGVRLLDRRGGDPKRGSLVVFFGGKSAAGPAY